MRSSILDKPQCIRVAVVPLVFFALPCYTSAQIAPGVLQSAAQTATVTGTVIQSNGASVAGADVRLSGPGVNVTTVSDLHGGFVFLSVPYNSYRIDVNAKRIGMASRRDIVVKGDVTVTVQYLAPDNSAGLKEIARVSTSSSGAQINETAASIASITPRDYAFEGNTTWQHLLERIPGVNV